MYEVANHSVEDNTKLGPQPRIHRTARVVESEIGSWADIGAGSNIYLSTVGDYSYTAGDAQIVYTDVGKFCSVASHVRLNPGNHPMWRVTQHHFTYRRQAYEFDTRDDEEFFEWRKEHRVIIRHDVWIGHNATVMPGVKVGTGAVIGAGAVVTKDVDPYTIVVGVPAKPLRPRFPKEVADRLLTIAWWDWPRDVLEERFNDFLNLELFLEKYSV
ncbi:acetyltransferase [Alicyclobacillus fastidiosus]|uniref:Acetyltransferase n=1 Tax=Alicyclobacillus fastidiosus TaxID=392011 RepID=A0ABY6ZMR4_9BACL|nr:DapH/DapD/GlmU-related protein [Alicyclobacillus fastidiosus]WAH44127.1 acetyltransferase [Alicyclobacillus fastidiosus]